MKLIYHETNYEAIRSTRMTTSRRPERAATSTTSNQNGHLASSVKRGAWLVLVVVLIAFAVLPNLAVGLQQQPPPSGEVAHAEAMAAAAAAGQPMMSLASSSESGSPLETSSVLASDDLIAAESSQAPDSPAEHKAFTSGQMIRQDPQQQMAASVAPNQYNQAPVQQQQQQQQQPNGMYPAHLMARLQASHKANFNPFMAAAMAQQQMAAAAAGMHSQVPHAPVHHHHPQQQALAAGPPQHHAPQQHPGAGLHPHQQLGLTAGGHHHAQQQPQQHHPQQVHHMHQQQHQAPAPQQAMAVQESALRHNIVPAPQQPQQQHHHHQQQQPQQQQAAGPIEANSGAELADASSPTGTQMAVAQSAQHPVIATATSLAPAGGQMQPEAWPLQAPDIPKIVNLEVKCEKNLMKVSVEFDRVFNGVIFSKGHFNQGQCIHVPQNSAKQQAYFDISINSCGTQGNTQNGLYGMGGNTGSGTFFENTIVIQYDPNVQEVYDHARKLRCTWHDQYEKAVTFRPFPVDMLDIVRADFAGDNVGCWMQIQVGKGPWASEVAGIVKIGQTMTMVLAIKDEENKFDMLVRNCFAHDGKRGPIELVDKSGCITRPKLMSRFTKIKNFGSSATVLSYAHFQAFKFPDSMEVHFQCTIQICRHQCPEQCSSSSSGSPAIGGLGGSGGEAYSESTISGTFNINGAGSSAAAANNQQAADSMHLRKYGSASGSSLNRAKREASSLHNHHHRWLNGSHSNQFIQVKPLTQTVGVNRIIQVVSTNDLAFNLQQQHQSNKLDAAAADDDAEPQASQLTRIDLDTSNQICMSSYNFVLALVMLVLILVFSCLMAISLYLRQRALLRATGNGKLAHLMQASRPTSSASSSTLASNVPATPTMLHNNSNHMNNHNNHHHHQQHQHHQVPTAFNHDQWRQ